MSITSDVKLIISRIKEVVNYESNNIYTKREKIMKNLCEHLPILFSIPHLDIHTYNICILYLAKKHQKGKLSSVVLLHTWSFISGIKVIGLKHNSDFYYDNRHLLPASKEPPTLVFGDSIMAKSEEDIPHNHFDPPASLVSSSVFYRSNFGRSKLVDKRERQTFVKELFVGELCALEKDQSKDVLNCVLRVNQNRPCFTIGLTNLFQNTAIYLSSEEGKSRLITGPCSVSSISYLGLQNGIFVDKTTNTENVVDYLFGVQLFYRGLTKRFELDGLQNTEYYPNYPIVEENNLNVKEFGLSFKKHVRSPSSTSYIKRLVDSIDNQQLRIPYHKNEWLEFSYNVDLSSHNDFSADVFTKHINCFSYKDISSINLSRNRITSEGATKIAKILAKNILPELETLDLSENIIEVFVNFGSLLQRTNFKRFIIYGNPSSHTYQHEKTIWVERFLLNSITGEERQRHEEYYRYK